MPTGTCKPFSRKVFISAKGLIFPCEYIGFAYPLGEIKNKQGGLDFELIAKKYNNKLNVVKLKCSKCIDKNKCTACMYSSNILLKGENCRELMKNSEFNRIKKEVCNFFQKHPLLYKEMMVNSQMSER